MSLPRFLSGPMIADEHSSNSEWTRMFFVLISGHHTGYHVPCHFGAWLQRSSGGSMRSLAVLAFMSLSLISCSGVTKKAEVVGGACSYEEFGGYCTVAGRD